MQGRVDGNSRANRGNEDGGNGDGPARATERQEDDAGGEEPDRVEDLSRHHGLGTLPCRGNSLDSSANGVNHANERVDADREPRRIKNSIWHILVVPEVPVADQRRREDERNDAEAESGDDGIDEKPPVPFVLRLELNRDGQ